MNQKFIIEGLCVLAILGLTFSAASAIDAELRTSPKQLASKSLTGGEDLPKVPVVSGTFGDSQSPGTQVGDTYYDFQKNSSMGRQIVCTFEGNSLYSGIHIDWMCLPCEGGSRSVRYNSYDFISSTWAWGTGPSAGKPASPVNGGYCTIDVTSGGAAVIAYHAGPVADIYTTEVCQDVNPPLGDFQCGQNPGPPNCQGWETGSYEATSTYIWPHVEYDECGGDTVFHKITTESPPTGAPVGEIRTLLYDKCVWDNDAQEPICPPCAWGIDSVYSVSAVVRQDPTSDEIAIAWLHPIHYEDDPSDPCGFTQWQNDVYVWISPDCGNTWDPGLKTNVTDYTQGGAIPIDAVQELAYSDLSALYTHDGCLHVVWATPKRDGCTPLYSSKMWHWDDCSQIISLVYDASTPRFMADPGTWSHSTCKMNISECFAAGEPRLYVQFTRFGAHASATGDTSLDQSGYFYENGDIFLTGSTDGGLTWGSDPAVPVYAGPGVQQGQAVQHGTAVNLTNTFTPGCAPGACESEHWSSMAKYSNDSVHIEYIEDKDAGPFVYGEGDMTCNPVRYISHECFTPAPYCAINHSPLEVTYPPNIAPDGQPNCYPDYTRTIDLVLTNAGNEPAPYSVATTAAWISPAAASGTIPAGSGNEVTIQFTIGPIATEGIYCDSIVILACGGYYAMVPVCTRVCCSCVDPEYQVLSTACWSIAIWNVGRAGTGQADPEGNVYWYANDVSLMYDQGIIITNADDTNQTWFPIFDGSDFDVGLEALTYLQVADTIPTYVHSYGGWASPDTQIIGHYETYAPIHPDSCFLVERFSVCNATMDAITLHIGDAIDWDIPDGDGGTANQCGLDIARQMVYQHGPPGTTEENYYGGVSFTEDVVGAVVLQNKDWVYPNSGFDPAAIGGLLARFTGFEAVTPDSLQDMHTVYIVGQDVTLEPGECALYTMVKAASLTGLADLQDQIDKGIAWISDWDTPDEAILRDRAAVEVYHNQDNYLPPDGMGTFIWGTVWEQLYPGDPDDYVVLSDYDEGDGVLSAGDWLVLENLTTLDVGYVFVTRVTTTLKIQEWLFGGINYLDLRTPPNPLNNPLGFPDNLHTYRWHEVNPVYCNWWRILPIYDNLPGTPDGILSPCDYVIATKYWPLPVRIWFYHVEPDWPLLGADPAYPRNVPATDIEGGTVLIGDANASGEIDIDDVVYLIGHIFIPPFTPPVPHPVASGDANCDCFVDIGDVDYLIQYIFMGGPPPCTVDVWLAACFP